LIIINIYLSSFFFPFVLHSVSLLFHLPLSIILLFFLAVIHHKGMPQHSDDILCGSFTPPNNLLVASADGAFVCWNVDSGVERFSFRMNSEEKKKKLLINSVLKGKKIELTPQNCNDVQTGEKGM
jgi:WD40 repeat protein